MPSLIWATSAARQYRKVPPGDKATVDEALKQLREKGTDAPGVKALTNLSAQYRIRKGVWRVFFDHVPADDQVQVLAVERRNEGTYRS